MVPWPRALALLVLASLAPACVVSSGRTVYVSGGDLSAEARTELDRPLELQPDGRLAVDVPAGSVTLRVSDGPASVHARLRVRAATQAEADAALARLELSVRDAAGGVRVEVLQPEDSPTHTWVSADLEVALPPRCALDVRTGTGAVRCESGPFGASDLRSTYGEVVASDVHGGLRAESGSGVVRAAHVAGGGVELKSGYGNVKLEDCEADAVALTSGSGKVEASRVQAQRVELATTYGSARLQDVQGEARAKSGSGEVRAEGWSGPKLTLESGYGAVSVRAGQGDLELKSGSGNVVVEGCTGGVIGKTTYGAVRVDGSVNALELESGSGEVRATARAGSRVDRDWSLKSGYGNVTLTLPQDLAFDLDVRTTYGKIDLGLPLEIAAGALKEKQVAGKVHGGGKRVSLSTGSGNVRIEPGSVPDAHFGALAGRAVSWSLDGS